MRLYYLIFTLLTRGALSFDYVTEGDGWYEGLERSGVPGPEQDPAGLFLFFKDDLVVDFMLFTRENRGEAEVMKVEDFSFKSFNSSRDLKIIVHGWRNGFDSPVGDILKEAYLDSSDINVIVVDWSSRSFRNYIGSRMSVPKVAEVLANMVESLVRDGLDPSKVHMVGHSLGAHVAGIAGLRLPYKIARVTGLDPAAPMFTSTEQDILKPESAMFVDVIHTCGNILGLMPPLGHADFYPNGGTPIQPGCGLDVKGECSHSRAYELFAESISSQKLLAIQCPEYTSFNKSTCLLPPVPMGEHTPSTARGIFFLETRRRTPFALGVLSLI